MKIKPLNDNILIEPIKKEEKTKGGIVLPQTSEKESQEGIVIAVGEGKLLPSGKRLPIGVKKNDRVLFRKYGPDEIKINDKEYLITKVEDILAIIE